MFRPRAIGHCLTIRGGTASRAARARVGRRAECRARPSLGKWAGRYGSGGAQTPGDEPGCGRDSGASDHGMQAVRADKPVVFEFSGDPVDVKLVESSARPGGNFTGLSYLALE